MLQNPEGGLLPLSAWQAESLRLTAFPDPSVDVKQSDWWQDVVGEAPETRTSQPRKMGWEDEGPLGDQKLVLRVHPIRIDWLLMPKDEKLQEALTFPTIGPLPDMLEIFRALVSKWFQVDLCPALKRLAFGAILLMPVDNRRAGYQQLAVYLPTVQLDPDGSLDFSYQINRPRNSATEIASLRINRLTKWSVATWMGYNLSVGLTSPRVAQQAPLFACRLALDINTAPDFEGTLNGQQLPLVFDELVELGIEIVHRGDVS